MTIRDIDVKGKVTKPTSIPASDENAKKEDELLRNGSDQPGSPGDEQTNKVGLDEKTTKHHLVIMYWALGMFTFIVFSGFLPSHTRFDPIVTVAMIISLSGLGIGPTLKKIIQAYWSGGIG